MKKKNILFLIMSALMVQSSVFAAMATFYNKTPYAQDVEVFADGSRIDTIRLGVGEVRKYYDTTRKGKKKAFTKLIWKAVSTKDDMNGNPRPNYIEKYSANIPSSANMNLGEITLLSGGSCGVNFDANGDGSPAKYKTIAGTKVN